MNSEKKTFAGWWFFVAGLLLLTIPLFWALNTAGIFGKTVAERAIFEQSYQKKAGDKSKASIFRAQLAEIESRLRSPSLTDALRADLEAQRSSIRIQLSAIEGN
jgi:hypothetical protein